MKPTEDSRFSSSFRHSPNSYFSGEDRSLDASEKARSSRVPRKSADSDVDDAWDKIASDLERIDELGSDYDDFERWNDVGRQTVANSSKDSDDNSTEPQVDDAFTTNDAFATKTSSRDSLRRAANVLPNEIPASNDDDKLSEDYETRNKRRSRSVWDSGDWTSSYRKAGTPAERSSSFDRRTNASDRYRFNRYGSRREAPTSPNQNSRTFPCGNYDDFSRQRGRRETIDATRFQGERTEPRRTRFERDANFRPSDARGYYDRANGSEFAGTYRPNDDDSFGRRAPFERNGYRRRESFRRRPDFKPSIGAVGRYGEPLSLAEEYAERRARRNDRSSLGALYGTPDGKNAGQIDDAFEPTSEELALLRERSIYELIEDARRLDGDPRGEIVKRALRERVIQAGLMFGVGTLEILSDGFGFLRSVETSYLSCSDDVYVSPSQIRRFGLRNGLVVSGLIRPPKERERYFALLRIDSVNGREPDLLASTPFFDDLVTARPTKRLKFEGKAPKTEEGSQETPESTKPGESSITAEQGEVSSFDASSVSPSLLEASESSQGRDLRLLDVVLPFGFGQRALLVCPPRSGKTPLLRKMVKAVLENYDDAFAFVVLVKKRPEDLMETRRLLANDRCEVVGSTFDEPNARHVQIANTAFEKAKRMVEYGENVVVFVDSLTRIVDAWRDEKRDEQNMTSALQYVRKLFGSARKIDPEGSLTIVATSLWNEDDLDAQLELDALQSVGHATLWLDSTLANKNIWPPINVVKSSTRDCRDFIEEEERVLLEKIRENIQTKNATDAIEELLDKIGRTSNNAELLRAFESDPFGIEPSDKK